MAQIYDDLPPTYSYEHSHNRHTDYKLEQGSKPSNQNEDNHRDIDQPVLLRCTMARMVLKQKMLTREKKMTNKSLNNDRNIENKQPSNAKNQPQTKEDPTINRVANIVLAIATFFILFALYEKYHMFVTDPEEWAARGRIFFSSTWVLLSFIFFVVIFAIIGFITFFTNRKKRFAVTPAIIKLFLGIFLLIASMIFA